MIESTRSPERDRYDELEPITAVVTAWTEPWPDADWRELCRQEIRETMPALARALDRLATMIVPPVDLGGEPLLLPEPEAVNAQIEAPADEEPVEIEVPADEASVEELAEESSTSIVVEPALSPPPLPIMPAVDDAEFVIEGKTVEEIGVRGREASIRLQAWGRRNGYREAAAREADLRMRLIVDLYHRDGITQQMIADMFGISPWRITQILNVHYERLHNERTAKKGRK